MPGDACEPCDCGATDPCAGHTDTETCRADSANACVWFALGRPCEVGVPCVSGVCQHEPTGGGDGPTCGVTTDSLAFCWGANSEGQLGDGTTTDRLTPVQVAGGHHFRQINEGSHHSCAVTTGDQAFCWGQNSLGELGDGTTTNRLTPVAVAPPAP